MTQRGFDVGDVIWVGALQCGYKATVINPGGIRVESLYVRDGYMVRTDDGQEFWCPAYAMRPFDLLDVLAAQ